jgi:fatty-acyl-CoA synthase
VTGTSIAPHSGTARAASAIVGEPQSPTEIFPVHPVTIRVATPRDEDAIWRAPMTMSYARGARDVPLLDETIGASLRRTVQRFPEREALVVGHQRYRATYAELWRQVDSAARALMAHGVGKGDRVGIWAPNRREWVVIQFATARVGAILVTINPAYKASELRHALNKAGVSLLVHARGFRDADYAAQLQEIRADCPELREAIALEDDWNAFLEDGERVDGTELAQREASLRPGDPINIQYTSGTTGAPKGATLSHRNILNNAYFTARALGYSERDRVCVPVPFYHCFGMVLGNLACATHGACIVVPGESFQPAMVLETVEAERCTSLYGVPTMFIAELAEPGFARFELSSLRTGAMGGAPCPVEVMKQVRSRMHMSEVAIVCGMTETSPVSTQTAPDDPLEKRVGTVGRVHPHVEIKVVDPDTGAVVPRGTPGEQCTRGYSVMLGYWNDPEATRRAVDTEGWMHTGDLAVMDADGYLSIVGRIKDMIIRGGENIYPREIEEFLHGLPGVADAHVIGIPSERYGEEVMAWVKPQTGAALTPAGLAAACRGRIASFKIPAHWRIVDSFPMTVTGKIQKYRLRELATAT